MVRTASKRNRSPQTVETTIISAYDGMGHWRLFSSSTDATTCHLIAQWECWNEFLLPKKGADEGQDHEVGSFNMVSTGASMCNRELLEKMYKPLIVCVRQLLYDIGWDTDLHSMLCALLGALPPWPLCSLATEGHKSKLFDWSINAMAWRHETSIVLLMVLIS